MKHQLTIRSDGAGFRTEILIDGKRLHNITAFDLRIRPDELVTANMRVLGEIIDIAIDECDIREEKERLPKPAKRKSTLANCSTVDFVKALFRAV